MEQTEAKPWSNVPATGPMLRPDAAAAYLGYSTSHFYALVGRGDLPPPVKMGRGQHGASAVPKPWLDAVIASWAAGDGS